MNNLPNDPLKSNTSPDQSSTEQADHAALALKSSVISDAHDLTDEAKHVASDVITHARKSAETQISGGKDRVADGLGSVAEAIRHTGEQMRSKDEAGLTEYVVRAADQVEAAADYLKERSLGDVLGDLGSLARREPAMFLGGAFVLGLVGGRFLKSSRVQPAPVAGPSMNSQSTIGRRDQRSETRPGGSRAHSRGESMRSSSSGSAAGGYAMPSPGKANSADKPRDLTGTGAAGTGGHDMPNSNGGVAKMPGAV
jgi:hypothetical protein